MFTIKELCKDYIKDIEQIFSQAPWYKSHEIFDTYYQEHIDGTRTVWVGFNNNVISGYITLKYKSSYLFFYHQNIPEIMDLNVIPQFRNQGLATQLLHHVEQYALQKGYQEIGLGVGLYKDYGVAQRLYSKKGYIPDGQGITYNYLYVIPGTYIRVEDDLVLWLSKKLR